MLKIEIQGLKNGVYDYEWSVVAKSIPGMYNEFFGEVKVAGRLTKLNNRYSFSGNAQCKANLICDRSLKEFVTIVKADFSISFIADSALLAAREKPDFARDETNIIHGQEKYMDLSEEVRQQLAVNLPLRRVAPQYEEVDLNDLYPEISAKTDEKSEEFDERWGPLKNIKLN